MTRSLQNGRYEVLDTIGLGASSRVERARDTIIGRIVALKTFVQGLNLGCEQQFLHEAKIIGQLSHPSIVQLYDVGTDENGAAYLVLEFVAGNTLEHLLTESPIALRRASAWGADLASALAVSHAAGIIHSDVKPGNIFVTGDFKVKLGDFGVARFATQLSGSGRVTGTPAYLSPEQIQGEKQDHRSDLFSLGIVLYEMAVGKRPFDGASLPAVCAQILNADYAPPSRIDSSLPPAFDQVIARCLAKNPADRFQSAEELATNLYPLARAVVASSPSPRRSWLSKPAQSREVFIYSTALILLAGSALALRSLPKRLRLPSPPVHAFTAPKPPSDLLGYPQTDLLVASDVSKEPVHPTTQAPANHKDFEPHSSQPIRSNRASAKTPATSIPVVPVRSAEIAAQSPPAIQLADLSVDISSTIAEGTLAIFADQKLLLTTPLRAGGKNSQLQLHSQLPAGTHQLRVALYRPDQTLQSEKEGLADIQVATSNVLGVRVARHSKFLVRRENALEVVWPAATSLEQHSASISMNALSIK